jgi:RNA polymerase sigma-70 factor, ECF subfamily
MMGQSTRPATRVESNYLEDLIADILQGDTSALSVLYEHTVASVSAEARAFTASWDDANEIVRGVYEQAWRRLSSYDPASGSVLTWLCGIARELASQRKQAAK